MSRWDRPPVVLVIAAWVVALVSLGVAVTAAFNLVAAPFRGFFDPTPSMAPAVENLILLGLSAAVTAVAFRYATQITNEVLR